MLRCRDLTEDASRLMDGDVALPRRLRLRLHLALCSMCRTYMDQMRKTRAMVARRPLAPMPPAEEEALIARITGAPPRDQPPLP
jgi:predicted anti-sigma-YlaC factor YlaD